MLFAQLYTFSYLHLLSCSAEAGFATKGYFAVQYHVRERQVGRLLATQYEEVVVDRLFAGDVHLIKALQPLVQAPKTTLELDEAKVADKIALSSGVLICSMSSEQVFTELRCSCRESLIPPKF